MNRVSRFVCAVTTVIALANFMVGHAAAFDAFEGGSRYNGQYQPSQQDYASQPRQYAPTQPSYQQSYNYNSNDSYRRQFDYGRASPFGSQPGGYQPQQYGSGSPSDQQYGGSRSSDEARGHAATDDEGRSRRRRRQRRATHDGPDDLRPHRQWASREPTNRDNSGESQPRRSSPGRGAWGDQRGVRVRTTLPTAAAVSQGSGWYGYGQMAVCVRTCDGYFFPLGLTADQASIDGQKSLCTALCPAAKTEIYFMPQGADGIETAFNAGGRPYSKMPHALRYTKSLAATCTCHGTGGQAHLVSLMKDFTMRRGDAVMTVNGVLVFNGAWHWPYKLSNFQVLDKAKYYLSNALALAALEKAALRLQQAVRRPKQGGEKAAAAGPFTFIKDNNGKTVRLVGEAMSYAPLPFEQLLTTAPAAPPAAKTGVEGSH